MNTHTHNQVGGSFGSAMAVVRLNLLYRGYSCCRYFSFKHFALTNFAFFGFDF